MRFILQFPEANGGSIDLLDAGSITEIAIAAERAGFDGLALTEHPAPGNSWLEAGGHQSLDPFVALSAAAAVTTDLHLITNLSVVPYRNPLVLAKSAATLDRMSNGRFIFGAGSGYLKSEYFAVGVDFEERNALFDEALEVMGLHWSGEVFSFEGRHFSARNIRALPAPVNRTIPMWIGGNSEVALRRVASHGAGWMPMMASPEVAKTARTRPIRGPEDLAERLLLLEDLAGDRYVDLDLIFSYGASELGDFDSDLERHREGLGQVAALGATWVFVGPPWSPAPGALEWIEAFGEALIDR